MDYGNLISSASLVKTLVNMKTLLSTISMLILTIVVGHQTFALEISGTVRDKIGKSPLSGVTVSARDGAVNTVTDQNGRYTIQTKKGDVLLFSFIGYRTQTHLVKKTGTIDIVLEEDIQIVEELVFTRSAMNQSSNTAVYHAPRQSVQIRGRYTNHAESYQSISENKFINPRKEALSTFAADVDAASYSNVRRFIHQGQLPPADAVRIEEMINYFDYNVDAPKNGEPVNISTELSQAPWNTAHQLLRISLKAKNIPTDQLPSSNFVFLIDVSGSMYAHNKLPLVKSSLKMLVDQLRDNDKVAIVTYAGSAGVKLESTAGSNKMKIKDAIDQLEAGGSTAGAAGIQRAYQIARENFISGGNNRIIMATDGDFNVGASSNEDMETLIAKQRESGVHISILGYGMGNYKDSKMERLANKGHGNYAYIDNISEARKAIITEFGGTLFTIAKDVKIQVEFNPHFVQAYRLVGYENRLLEAEDFNNDHKLGGDMGVGHTVTALYEIVPVGAKSNFAGSVDDLKYQDNGKPISGKNNNELATVKFRYKDPDSDKSKLKQHVIRPNAVSLDQASSDLQFMTAVAEWGMLIRNSAYKQNADFDSLIRRAKATKGNDEEGYRGEFIRMAEDAKALLKSQR